MRSRKALSFIALAAAGALALSGCTSGGDSASSGGESGGIISVNSTEPQKGLIPADTTEVGGGKVVDALWEGLVYYDAEGATQMGVAESIETDNGTTWTVKLRDDAVFSDGTPVLAKNFVDAWNYAANVDNALGNQYFFSAIKGFSETEPVEALEGLKIIDDQTFTIEATPDFRDRLGYSAYYPLPDVAFEDMEAYGQAPIGNGLYKLASDDAWKHDVEIKLVKNDTYVGPREVSNDGIDFKMYASLDAAYTDLLANNLDVLDQIPDTSFAVFQDELGDRAINQAGALLTTLTVSMNLNNFEGEEGKLRRQALSMAVDREEIIDVIFEGTNIPARDFTSPIVDGYTEDLKGVEKLDFNPEEAKKLWAEADAIKPFEGTLEVATNSDGPHQVWIEAVANQWSNTLGVTAAPKLYPTFQAFLDDRESDVVGGPFRSGWQADYPGAYNYLQPLYYSGASSNHGFYANPAFDTLLDEAVQEADHEKSIDKLHQAQEILLEDMPSIPLWYQGTTGGFSENVDNVTFGWNSVPIFNEITKK
ncbi:peptide ABC transporter substrate-binding protein [Leucobacter luti]|uniref:Oligopeptide transport system substrate-binding protein n=1 Tax=Leucobacter luti TaxID=340320 RepID=A0A4Q7U4H3_9MICO|nr:ABC transporter substrate-binding protein [Leucobacter luti]MBL3700599.1 ABC transporter substrate-binding protein [Leucobacter luti]RZT68564.1 oligopeptide transport system substrate-binding protein [Leucobacter luti]